jgi:predicted acylesterase/phospholipase RssA
LLRDRLNPFSKHGAGALNISTILMRTIAFGGAARRSIAVEAADLYIRVPLERFKINEFNRGKEMADAAHEFAFPRIRAWKAEAQPTAGAAPFLATGD